MEIFLKKFGTVLVSRPAGKEAFLALQPSLKALSQDEKIAIDFEGVSVFTPSWGDEFLTPFFEKYSDRVALLHTENPTVIATLETLEKAKKMREK